MSKSFLKQSTRGLQSLLSQRSGEGFGFNDMKMESLGDADTVTGSPDGKRSFSAQYHRTLSCQFFENGISEALKLQHTEKWREALMDVVLEPFLTHIQLTDDEKPDFMRAIQLSRPEIFLRAPTRLKSWLVQIRPQKSTFRGILAITGKTGKLFRGESGEHIKTYFVDSFLKKGETATFEVVVSEVQSAYIYLSDILNYKGKSFTDEPCSIRQEFLKDLDFPENQSEQPFNISMAPFPKPVPLPTLTTTLKNLMDLYSLNHKMLRCNHDFTDAALVFMHPEGKHWSAVHCPLQLYFSDSSLSRSWNSRKFNLRASRDMLGIPCLSTSENQILITSDMMSQENTFVVDTALNSSDGDHLCEVTLEPKDISENRISSVSGVSLAERGFIPSSFKWVEHFVSRISRNESVTFRDILTNLSKS